MTTQNTLSQNTESIQHSGLPVIVKVLAFMVILVLVFTGIANLLPQVEGQAPKETKVDLGALTMASYIAMGEQLFKGKGTCTLCHNDLGRAPNILALDMVATAKKHFGSDGYKGEAKDSEDYFRESMLEPSKYIVPGFGKQGEPSPMPVINKAPIALSDIEIGAIIAFLQAKDGGQPTIALPTDVPAENNQSSASSAPPEVAKNAQAVLTKNGCPACHTVLESTATIGPNLKAVSQRLSREKIRESIINPGAVIAEGYPPVMPTDFADKMMVKELEMVVDFLAQAGQKSATETEQKGE